MIDEKGRLYASYEGKRKEKIEKRPHKIIGSGSSAHVVKFAQDLETGQICILKEQKLKGTENQIEAQLSDMNKEASMAEKAGFHLGSLVRGNKRTDIQVFGGETLSNLLDPKKEGFIDSFDERFEIAKHMFNQVDHMHTIQGILHRDIKSENMFWDRETGQFRIGDYGLAEPMPMTPDQIFVSSELVGTPRALAPELLEELGNFKYSPTTDIFATGTVLMEAFGLKIPNMKWGALKYNQGVNKDDLRYESFMHSKSKEVQEIRNAAWTSIELICKHMAVIEPKKRLKECKEVEIQIQAIQNELNQKYEKLAEKYLNNTDSNSLINKGLSEDKIKEILSGCKAENQLFRREQRMRAIKQAGGKALIQTPRQIEQLRQLESEAKNFQEWFNTLTEDEKEKLLPALYTLSELPSSILEPRLTAALQKNIVVEVETKIPVPVPVKGKIPTVPVVYESTNPEPKVTTAKAGPKDILKPASLDKSNITSPPIILMVPKGSSNDRQSAKADQASHFKSLLNMFQGIKQTPIQKSPGKLLTPKPNTPPKLKGKT